jgi:hypothetical protein
VESIALAALLLPPMLLLLLQLLHNERGAADVAAAALAAIRAPQPQTAARPNREILHIDSESIRSVDRAFS